MPSPKQDLNTRLRRYLTPTNPMGPSDASQIKDVEVAARLFDPHNKSFNTLLRRDLSVVIGRRGSGKTALLNSYKYRPYLDAPDHVERPGSSSDHDTYDIVIEVISHEQFEGMQRFIDSATAAFRPIEGVVDEWQSMITDFLFATLIAEEGDVVHTTHHLAVVRAFLNQEQREIALDVRRAVWGPSLWAKLVNAMLGTGEVPHVQVVSRDDALWAAVNHLKQVKKRAVIIFDSMDEYDVSNASFTRTVSALLRFISHFNAQQDRMKIKLGLPLEIFPEIQRASANPLKDLVSVDQVQWGAMELAQIAAYRYRLFLELYDPAHAGSLEQLDLNRREDVRTFWSHFFKARQINKYGTEEEPLTYVLRHTQLLPRQVLMILQRIVISSAAETGGYREFKAEAVTAAIEEMEPLVASEILRAFRYVYPHAEQISRPVFANCPTVLSFDELEDKWRKKGRPTLRRLGAYVFDTTEFAEMLMRMGILGVVEEERDRYFEGSFGYDALAPRNIGEGNKLCLHPIFSRHFSAAGNERRKAVIPHGVSIRWS